jgi:hypothetical protein
MMKSSKVLLFLAFCRITTPTFLNIAIESRMNARESARQERRYPKQHAGKEHFGSLPVYSR